MSNSATKDEAYASLRFAGDKLDPSDVTRKLQLPPDTAVRKGDPNIERNQKGQVEVFDDFAAGVWVMSSRDWVNTPDINYHVRWILQEVEPRRGEVEEMLGIGVRGDLFCFSRGPSPDHPEVDEALLERVEELGLQIKYDHYCTATEGVEE